MARNNDSYGKVIAGQGVEQGSSLNSISSVNSALHGIAGYSFDDIGAIGYSMIATAPVRSKGKVSGVVIAAYSLVDGNLTNQIKESYSAACTIFKGSIRVATTLGSKYVGTSLDNQEIINAVIKDRC